MKLKEILKCLGDNGFRITPFNKAYNSHDEAVCDSGYILDKYDSHIATLDKLNGTLTTFAAVKKAYKGKDHYEVRSFKELDEEYIKGLRLHTEDEYNQLNHQRDIYYLKNRIENSLEQLEKCKSDPFYKDMKQKLKEALKYVKTVKEPPPKY